MFETVALLLGLGFSFFVFIRSIRPLDLPWSKKAFFFFITLIGITGMLFLSGVVIAHFLRKLGLIG